MGTPARHKRADGQECPSYNHFATDISLPVLIGQRHLASGNVT